MTTEDTQGNIMQMEIIEMSKNVSPDLFELPSEYQKISY